MSVPTRLRSTLDAIHVAEEMLGDDDLLALIDGDAPVAMPISGDVPPDAVLNLDELVLGAFGDDPGRRLVLATRRETGPSFVLEDELLLWGQLKARHAGSELELCDWLVFVRDDVVLSLAEIAGPPARWR